MEGEIVQKNISERENSLENNKALNLNEENAGTLNKENDSDKINLDTKTTVNPHLEDEENEEKEEAIDFEQIKRNHMLMMNNINMSTFENDFSTKNNQRMQNNSQLNNQFNNFANLNTNDYNNFNPNCPNISFNNQNVGFQGIPMPYFPNQGMVMPFAPQGGFIPAPPRFGPPNQMMMHNNQNYFFDCNPFALFMQRKVSTGNNINKKQEEKEDKPFFFSFSNTLLANNPNAKNEEESNKGVDLTKMTRFNVKFINPFNGRVNQTDVLIETKHVKEYGEFHKEWKEKIIPIEQTLANNTKIITGYSINFINEKTEKTVNLSPLFILLSLIDAKIAPSLVPESWKSSKANDDFVKIKFKNSNKIMYLNKRNRTIMDKIPRKITTNNQNAVYPNTPYALNPSLLNKNIPTAPTAIKNSEAENTIEKISFVEELENEDIKLKEAKLRRQQEMELELKRQKEKKILSKLLGKKHYLLKDSGAEGTDKSKKQKKEKESDEESEENIVDEIEEGNFDLNLTVAELKIRYSNEIKLYKELMEEIGVNIYTKFQDILPKLIYDARYLKVPKKIRERIFDEYVREKEAKEKEAKEKEEKEAEETINREKEEKEKENKQSNFNLNLDYQENEIPFSDSNREIERFKETEKYSRKAKELDLKGKEKEEYERKIRKISQEKLKALIKSQIEKGEIHSNTPFSEFEARNIDNMDFYNALQIDREFLFNEAKLKVKKLLEERKKNNIKKFKDMLYSKISPFSITESTTVHEIKKQIKHEKEYEIISSSQEKKDLIQEFITEMQKLISHSKNKSDIVANKKELELKIAEEEFKKFLAENIKTEISWEEANRKFFNASTNMNKNNYNNQKTFSNGFLSEDKKMQIFKDFIYNLHETKKRLLRQLYEEKIGLNQDIAWHDVQHMLQNDKKFRDVIEREREALFIEYKVYVQERILAEFHQFLNETTLINKDSPTEGPLFNSLVSKLNSDIRFQRLERNPDKRDKFLRAKIRSLKYEFEKKERNERKAASAMHREFDRDRDRDRDAINRDWREDKFFGKK